MCKGRLGGSAASSKNLPGEATEYILRNHASPSARHNRGCPTEPCIVFNFMRLKQNDPGITPTYIDLPWLVQYLHTLMECLIIDGLYKYRAIIHTLLQWSTFRANYYESSGKMEMWPFLHLLFIVPFKSKWQYRLSQVISYSSSLATSLSLSYFFPSIPPLHSTYDINKAKVLRYVLFFL